MTLVEEIRNQLSKVFTPNGDVKVCGRDECRKAIQIASEICPGVDFGNLETGVMNLQTFHDCFFCDKELKKQLFKVFDTQGTLLPINHADCRKLIAKNSSIEKKNFLSGQPRLQRHPFAERSAAKDTAESGTEFEKKQKLSCF